MDESNAAKEKLLEVQNDLAQTQLDLEDATRRLGYLKPIQVSDIKELFSLRFITLTFAWGFMAVAVVIAILAISEIQKRQQFIQIVGTRMEEVQQELVTHPSSPPVRKKSTTDPPASTNGSSGQSARKDGLTERLRQLHRIRTDVHLLVATGATTSEQRLEGIRERLLKLNPLSELSLEIEQPEGDQSERERRGWFFWIEDFVLAVSGSAGVLLKLLEQWSSDLLLSLVVILAGSIGAVVAAMRAGVLFTFRELGLGLAAGLITFLVIRSGRSIFIMQSSGVTFVLNPYASAFFGMAAGIFTDRAYRLLMAVISKLVGKIQEAFELDPAEVQGPGHVPPAKPAPPADNDGEDDPTDGPDQDGSDSSN